MKNYFRLFLIALTLMNFALISCTKDDDAEQNDDQAVNSEAARTLTQTLYTRTATTDFTETAGDLQDYLNGDFCFTFVYPITLMYNNGTQVVVNDDAQLLDIISNMTTSLYITGIAFPFDVNTANGVQTINNETSFLYLISTCDTDNDGSPNYVDTDDDNDGISDDNEDTNNDGNEFNDDTDGDGTPDCQDSDDDGDGIDTADEDLDNDGDPTNDDSDGDGIPNCQDDDDDNDGVPTADEDNDHNGDVADDDSDNDGTPDYLDTDSDNDGIDDGDDSDADGDGEDDDQETGNDDNNDGDD